MGTDPSTISYKPHIKSKTVQGGFPGSGVWMGQVYNCRGDKGDQGAYGGRRSTYIRLSVATLVNGTGGSEPEETRANFGAHGFWRQWTTMLFDVCIVNLDASSYLFMAPEKARVKAEK